jgi:hypothetical protein|tara:strand:+ start:1841 stop:2032 length:192 start_codon:yes stop_codon:yes gene_type:complete
MASMHVESHTTDSPVTFEVDTTSIRIEPFWDVDAEETRLRVVFLAYGQDVYSIEWDGQPESPG